MNLQDNVESFLSNAEVMFFRTEGSDTILNIIFGKKDFDVFKDLKSHENLKEYFKNRNVKMVINHKDTINTCLLVDINSGDCLNIRRVKFVAGNFESFLAMVPKDRVISLFVCGLSKDGSTMVLAPLDPNKELTQIQGYSVVEN